MQKSAYILSKKTFFVKGQWSPEAEAEYQEIRRKHHRHASVDCLS